MEADLRRFAHVSPAELSFTQTAWVVRHLPPEAAIHGHGWSIEAMLLADVVQALTGQRHPSDPRKRRSPGGIPADELAKARRRAAQRRKELGITGSVLRRKPKGVT